ncbi:hypothetical protein HT031_002015 [Scenedesmus sp. PABB004]|nr:hypothetical protein HT031_002015 [Scenedesmus sp. PABB004]
MYLAKVVSHRQSDTDVIRRLKKSLCAKRRQLSQLEAQHSQLEQEHHVLVCFCDALRRVREEHGQLLAGADLMDAEVEELAMDAEQALLQELAGVPYDGGPAAAPSPEPLPVDSSSGAADDDSDVPLAQRPCAPAHDPWWLLHRALAAYDGPAPASLTCAHLQEACQAAERELLPHLANFDALTAGQAAGAAVQPGGAQVLLDKLQRVFERLLSRLVLGALVRPELAVLRVTNLVTGEMLTEPSKERHAWVLPQLQLSPAQERQIALSVGLFQRLWQRLCEERRLLQTQQQDSGAGASSADGGDEAIDGLPQPFTHGRLLEERAKRSARLELLLQKIARMHVLMHPWFTVPWLLYSLIAEKVDAEQRAAGGTGRPQQPMYRAKVVSNRLYDKDLIRRLKKSLWAKRRQLSQLEAQHSQLEQEHHVLVCFCDALRRVREEHGQLLAGADLMDAEVEELAMDAEQALLQELAGVPYDGGPAAAPSPEPLPVDSSSGAADDDSDVPLAQRPCAPAHDPWWLLHRVLAAYDGPAPASLTCAHLQEACQAAEREASLHLASFDALTAGQAAGAAVQPGGTQVLLDKLQRVFERLLSRLVLGSLVRPELAVLRVINLVTGEMLTEPSKERHAWVLPQLQLSPAQERQIALSVGLFQRLWQRLCEERRLLQTQQQDSGAGASSADGGDEAIDGLPQPFTHGRLLEERAKRSARLELLLQKEAVMHICFTFYFLGCLSWVQIARMHVLMHPWFTVPWLLYSLIAEKVDAEQRAAGGTGRPQQP